MKSCKTLGKKKSVKGVGQGKIRKIVFDLLPKMIINYKKIFRSFQNTADIMQFNYCTHDRKQNRKHDLARSCFLYKTLSGEISILAQNRRRGKQNFEKKNWRVASRD